MTGNCQIRSELIHYTHVQIGADRKHELDGVDLFTGALLTYTDSNASSHAFS
ncbi:autotransporter outer membrane beta-barrel domain-containing protein, partial [Escherichia coli]|nr:autotransporter outer membrane beta-barrel domain-containing protein [Escherichia coli]EGO8824596.1 autotransporter outer membrane beta-barrel domain-containing protein [Escherichia coli]